MRLRHFSIAAVVVTAGATLVGCTPWYANEGCTPAFEPGSASNAIDTTADEPFEVPMAVDETQVSIRGGEGEAAGRGDAVVADYSLYDGATGTLLETSDADVAAAGGVQAMAPLTRIAGADDALSSALLCSQSGSTTTLVTTFGEAFGDAIASSGIDPQGTAVVVFSVSDTFAGRADGWPQPAAADMPSVSLAPDGRPGITWAGVPAPTEVAFATTIQGGGDTVEADSSVIVQYSLLEWGSSSVRQSTWDSVPATLAMDGVIAPFHDALLDAQVGSQVVIAVPSDDGYQDGDLFFVVDILDIVDE